MNNQEINIAIAEACGEEYFKTLLYPQYTNCLNLMNEALHNTDSLCRERFLEQLYEVVGFGGMSKSEEGWLMTTATARQRAEAFLRALDLWEEEA